MLLHYLNELNYQNMPEFLNKYFLCPSLIRLKNIGYFCGMDYASKDVYDFKEYISRFDHSLTVALLTYKLTSDKVMTLAGLFHDIATPCFSHVIDYMNGDFLEQESTEEYTESILKSDYYLKKCLKEDNIAIEDIIDFKKYTIVDNDRPKLCADRLDGIIITGSCWTKNITNQDITNIVKDLVIYKNEQKNDEIGFKSLEVAKKVLDVSTTINTYCHSKEDNYMMLLLAKMTKYAIGRGYISYNDLYAYDERELFNIFKSINDKTLIDNIHIFETIKKATIPDIVAPKIKVRNIYPIVSGKRIKE